MTFSSNKEMIGSLGEMNQDRPRSRGAALTKVMLLEHFVAEA
jgi:hypothetical protein